jgi:4-hydroxybenzoyl-CoA reductase subunit beta
MKHGLYSPKRVVSLRRISSLKEIRETEEGGMLLGAGVTLAEVAAAGPVRRKYPALATAAGLVAGPQIRNMGTLGGNICLETRCVYYNQTEFWRSALGYCIKKDGTVCHVVTEGSRCLAACSGDTPGPLVALGAEFTLVSKRGERRVQASDFFRSDGSRNTVREPDEILTGILLPPPGEGQHSAYQKLRTRQSIDFPALSVTAAARILEGRFQSLTLLVGAIASRPRTIRRVEELVVGSELTEALAEKVGQRAHDQCHPLSTISMDPDWRRDVLPVFVRRALYALEPSVEYNRE